MESMLVRSFPNASSIITVGALASYEPKASHHKRKIQKEYNFLKLKHPSLKHHYESIEGGFAYRVCNRKYAVKADPGPSFESEHDSFDPKNVLDSIKGFLDAIYSFSTPFAFIAKVLCITSTSLLAVEKLSDISPLFFIGVLEAVVPALLMNVYVNGLNQLCDVEIDKINKPYLPLASGHLSFANGVIVVASCLILSLWLGWIIGSRPLMCALLVPFVLGTAYSVNVPLLRWKRDPVLAAMCIVATWAFTPPIAYFLHMQTFVFKRPAVFSRPLTFAIVFMSFFSLSIALYKDIPDIEGDKKFGIQSFSQLLGQKRVFWICVSLIEMAYGVAVLVGASSSCLWSKIVTVLGHAVLASVFLYRAKSVDLRSKASIASSYMFIWKLLWVEYLLLPLVR